MSVRETTWRGLPALALQGGGRTAILGLVGGQLASLCFDGEEIHPLWQPTWPAADPTTLDRHGLEVYGVGPDAPLLAAACGSFLCCDRFGPPAPGSGGSTHGEAAITRYVVSAVDAATVVLSARLAQAELEVHRCFTFVGEELELATTVRHQGSSPRVLDWCEHTTLGGAFLDTAAFTAAVDRVVASPWSSSRFPGQACGADLDPATALAMPGPAAQPWSDLVTARVAGGWWKACSQSHRLTCTFDPKDWPWLTVWTEHRSRTNSPWQGRERARGMELSTKPFPEAEPPPERRRTWLGRPVETAIPPNTAITRRLRFHWEHA